MPRANERTHAPNIGVLDSGVGGLSVLREIHRLLPDFPTLYIADQAHLPYGPRPVEELFGYVEAMTRFLVDQGAVMVVLACHSASAASLQPLRDQYPHIPFVGMEPAVKPAVEATRSGVVGVLTTKATAEGALYRRVLARYATDVKVITQVAPGLVTLAEEGARAVDEAERIIRHYVEPLREAGADQIVLACTHFPFLADSIRAVAGDGIALVDPSEAVARQVARVLPPVQPVPTQSRYYTTGDADRFGQMVKRLTGVDASVGRLLWNGDDIKEIEPPGRQESSSL